MANYFGTSGDPHSWKVFKITATDEDSTPPITQQIPGRPAGAGILIHAEFNVYTDISITAFFWNSALNLWLMRSSDITLTEAIPTAKLEINGSPFGFTVKDLVGSGGGAYVKLAIAVMNRDLIGIG